ncbi:MAG: hypothetical protein LC100_15350 [Chitinophagales bacterium]|nr:hypothetical protein [Chitinophagales bacterium]
MTTQEQSLVDRLRIRSSIRRSIPSRKSVQEGKPDRIDSRGQSLDDDADLLEESAEKLEAYEKHIVLYESHIEYQNNLIDCLVEYNKELERKHNDLKK